jgi:hypothetical protein
MSFDTMYRTKRYVQNIVDLATQGQEILRLVRLLEARVADVPNRKFDLRSRLC